MKYKAGDKVKIKTDIIIKPKAKEDLKNLNTNCIVTIREVLEEQKQYIMEETKIWSWRDEHIEGLDPPVIISLFPTNKRFELMDLE